MDNMWSAPPTVRNKAKVSMTQLLPSCAVDIIWSQSWRGSDQAAVQFLPTKPTVQNHKIMLGKKFIQGLFLA